MSSLCEKYRPSSLDEIAGNNEVMKCLRSLNISNLPNMLFYGPPGTGKTTAIRAILKNHSKKNILELNASDERGINVVRQRIKEFSSWQSKESKIVILDEADSMSREAQNALRRIIEDYKNTRFCFICNYSKKIIDPIKSRCTKFRFCPVFSDSRIKEICIKENIKFTDEGINLILKNGDGDMRKVMNDLDGLRSTYGSLTEDNVLKFYEIIDDGDFDKILESLKIKTFDELVKLLNSADVDCLRMIDRLGDLVIRSDMKNKYEIIKCFSDIESRISVGCNEDLQRKMIISIFILNR